MEVLPLALAILNLYGLVLRALFTTHPRPVYWSDNGVNCPAAFLQDDVSLHNAGIKYPAGFVPVTRRVACPVFVDSYSERPTSVCYTRDQLFFVNKRTHSISSATAVRLSQLGIERTELSASKVKKYKRGKRGGSRKRRPITVVTGNWPVSSYVRRNNVSPKNLITIDTRNALTDLSKSLKITLLNTQSIKEKATLLNDFIHESNSDIVFFTESWLQKVGDEVIIASLTPPGYKSISVPRESRGGGICVIYKSGLNILLQRTPVFKTFECCEIILTIKGYPINFICIYRPPPNKKNKLKVKDFISEFQDLLDLHSTKSVQPLILGDFNLHFEDQSDSNVNKIKSILETRGLSQLIKVPTHIKKHTLDWVITNNPSIIGEVQVFNKCLSDHFVVCFEVTGVGKPKPRSRTVTTRRLVDIDHVKFSADIRNLVQSLPATEQLQTFTTGMKDLLEQHAPIKSRTVTDRPSAPWMTLEIKRGKMERRRAERRWRSTKLSVHEDIFRHCNNKVKSLIASAKFTYCNEKIKECTTSKALFSITNQLSGKKDPTSCKFPSNVFKKDLPRVFAQYFSDKVSKIRENIDMTPHKQPTFETFSGVFFNEFESVTREDVRAVIMSSPHKTCFLDPIPTPLLITHLDSIIEFITLIINESLRSGEVPSLFKHALVNPLLKKSGLSPDQLKNFRPVSNLPFLSKVLEKVVLVQLKRHLIDHNLHELYQSAYRQFHNTETALLKIYNDLLCEADANKISILALLDLSAAFDTIDHSILIERLFKTFGLSGKVLDWFRSYLTGRTQAVVVHDSLSPTCNLCFGVPQGSVLGPILYTLYTQPLGVVIRKHNVNYHLYADDTQLYKSVNTSDAEIEMLSSSMGLCIDDVKNWMIDNKLQLNEEKTEIILCNPKKSHIPIHVDHISTENEKLSFSDRAKNLGVYFDSKLSMEGHVNYLSTILFCELRRIGQMSMFLNEYSLKTLVSSFLFSRIDYCNALLANLPDAILHKLQRFQNHAARLVLKKRKRDHITPMLRTLHWLPVSARISYKIAVLTHKCIHKKAPSYLSDLVQIYIPPRSLRSRDKHLLKVPKKGGKKLAERSFSHLAPSVWNSLPLPLRSMPSESKFKVHLKTHLMASTLTD